MSDSSRLTQTLSLGGRDVTVRELTVGEIRRTFRECREDVGKLSLGDLLQGDGWRKATGHFLVFTNLTPEDLEGLTPSEMKRLWAAVQEVNADFFALMGGLEGALGLLGDLLKSSTGSASSSLN